MDNTIRIIPDSLQERTRLRHLIVEFAAGEKLSPPLSIPTLERLADGFIGQNRIDGRLRDWIMVELHNCAWRETFSSIPPERRLLLLPKCLSDSAGCTASIDDLGLLCNRCGRCNILNLQEYADKSGMLSLVAEGFTQVIELIRNNVVDAVIGVSCLDSLEKAFPLLIDNAVPGIAVSLNRDGCHDTDVDTDYVKELMGSSGPAAAPLLRYDTIFDEVKSWFTPENIASMFTSGTDLSTKAALDWICSDGKRWRPFLLTAVYSALTGNSVFPETVRMAAVAVECFHKASLVHDDIQDHDSERYGRPTVNALYGDELAINIGDLLLGEGYRLLARTGIPEVLQAVADAHILLCRGQGTELEWKEGTPVTMEEVTGIFRNKTVPAFEVALKLGLICAGGDEATAAILHDFSESLGIAYQINDDLDDAMDPSVPSALSAMRHSHPGMSEEEIRESLSLQSRSYRDKALEAVERSGSPELKRLLFQITGKILK